MKIIIIGLGSMGKRRIRLIQQVDKTAEIIGIDARSDRRSEAEKLYEICTRESLKEALTENADCAFVATSPLAHATIIRECLLAGLNVFTEINLVSDGYDENTALAKEKGLTLFLSSTPMYRKEIIFIINSIKSDMDDAVLSYQYHVGQYLPDWHPWEAFQDFFVSDKRTNGCRELLAVELPWLQEAFGEIESWHIQTGKLTKLPLDYCDTYQLLINHKSGDIGMLQIDVHSRLATRQFICTGENMYIRWFGTPDSLYTMDVETGKEQQVFLYEKVDHREEYSRNIIEDAYKEEIIEFFECIKKGKACGRHSFEKDAELLKIIDNMER